MTTRTLADRLLAQGLLDAPENLLTPLANARRVLPDRGHTRGLLLADDAAREEVEWFTEDAGGDTVLLATQGHHLRIEDLQPTFRRLFQGARLYAMQRNRYYLGYRFTRIPLRSKSVPSARYSCTRALR